LIVAIPFDELTVASVSPVGLTSANWNGRFKLDSAVTVNDCELAGG